MEPLGRPKCGDEDNIKTYLRETGLKSELDKTGSE
jgi:hypothetical protein